MHPEGLGQTIEEGQADLEGQLLVGHRIRQCFENSGEPRRSKSKEPILQCADLPVVLGQFVELPEVSVDPEKADEL